MTSQRCSKLSSLYGVDKSFKAMSEADCIKLQKNESCNSNSANIESKNCGNCNKDKGSYCQLADKTASKPDYGNYYCGDLNCVYKGKNYINGETWFDYDSYVGDGKDVVGSRSFKKICDKGIVKTEACEDFRRSEERR